MSQWVMPQDSGPHLFGTRDWFCGRQFFHEWRGGFQDDSSALHLLCTLFLLLSRQLRLRSSGTRFQRLSVPVLGNETDLNGWRPLSVSFLLGADWARVQLKSRFGDSGFEHVGLSWMEGLIWFYTIQGHLGQQMGPPTCSGLASQASAVEIGDKAMADKKKQNKTKQKKNQDLIYLSCFPPFHLFKGSFQVFLGPQVGVHHNSIIVHACTCVCT